jgi:hypothetical protein
MKDSTKNAAAAAGLTGAMIGFGLAPGIIQQKIGSEWGKTTTGPAHEQTAPSTGGYEQLLPDRVRVVGGFPVKQEVTRANVDPDQAAQEAIKKAGSYILQLKAEHDAGTLPEGVRVSSKDGIIFVNMGSKIGGEQPDGISEVSLSARVDKKYSNRDSRGVYRVSTTLGHITGDGEYHLDTADAESWKRDGKDGGWWKFGQSRDGSESSISIDNPGAGVNHSQFVDTTTANIASAVAAAQTLIADPGNLELPTK